MQSPARSQFVVAVRRSVRGDTKNKFVPPRPQTANPAAPAPPGVALLSWPRRAPATPLQSARRLATSDAAPHPAPGKLATRASRALAPIHRDRASTNPFPAKRLRPHQSTRSSATALTLPPPAWSSPNPIPPALPRSHRPQSAGPPRSTHKRRSHPPGDNGRLDLAHSKAVPYRESLPSLRLFMLGQMPHQNNSALPARELRVMAARPSPGK